MLTLNSAIRLRMSTAVDTTDRSSYICKEGGREGGREVGHELEQATEKHTVNQEILVQDFLYL